MHVFLHYASKSMVDNMVLRNIRYAAQQYLKIDLTKQMDPQDFKRIIEIVLEHVDGLDKKPNIITFTTNVFPSNETIFDHRPHSGYRVESAIFSVDDGGTLHSIAGIRCGDKFIAINSNKVVGNFSEYNWLATGPYQSGNQIIDRTPITTLVFVRQASMQSQNVLNVNEDKVYTKYRELMGQYGGINKGMTYKGLVAKLSKKKEVKKAANKEGKKVSKKTLSKSNKK